MNVARDLRLVIGQVEKITDHLQTHSSRMDLVASGNQTLGKLHHIEEDCRAKAAIIKSQAAQISRMSYAWQKQLVNLNLYVQAKGTSPSEFLALLQAPVDLLLAPHITRQKCDLPRMITFPNISQSKADFLAQSLLVEQAYADIEREAHNSLDATNRQMEQIIKKTSQL